MKKLINIDGRTVALTLTGKGEPLFFLHGWGGTKESWGKLTAELEKLGIDEERSLVALDFPGFGESEEPVRPWGVSDYAHFFEKLVAGCYREFDWSGNYDLAVHSFGGRVALKLLSTDFEHQITERPDKLVLIAAAGVKHQPSMRLRAAGVAAKAGKRVMKLPVLKKLAPAAQKILYRILKSHDYEKSTGIMRETFLKIIDEDLAASISHVKNPALVIWGKKDSYVPYSDGLMMHKYILGSQLITVPDGRHGIHKTHAAMLAPHIADFLRK